MPPQDVTQVMDGSTGIVGLSNQLEEDMTRPQI